VTHWIGGLKHASCLYIIKIKIKMYVCVSLSNMSYQTGHIQLF